MKKVCLLMAALCAGMLFGAEIPDFSKAETWKQASWTKSNYSAADGVLTIERPRDAVPQGSGAWRSVAFPVNAGDVISGTIDMHYVSQDGRGVIRLGLDCVDAKSKRIQFLTGPQIGTPNGGFETKSFSLKVPEGSVKAMVYLCIDGFGKAEFKNPVIK